MKAPLLCAALLVAAPSCPAAEIPPVVERVRGQAPADEGLDAVERAELERSDPGQKGGHISHDERMVLGVLLIVVAILIIA